MYKFVAYLQGKHFAQCQKGILDAGQILRAVSVKQLRQGKKHQWLEIVLTGVKNRHIRRMFGVLGVEIVRLMRVQIGGLRLGNLPKGGWCLLDEQDRLILQR